VAWRVSLGGWNPETDPLLKKAGGTFGLPAMQLTELNAIIEDPKGVVIVTPPRDAGA